MRPAVAVLGLSLTIALASLTAAQEQAAPSPAPDANAPATQGAPQPLPPQRPPSEYAVGEKPAPVEKTYDKKPKKVWKAILDAIEGSNVPLETADESSGYLKTKLIPFDPNRFYNVATPPPAMTKARPIRQWMGLNQGNFSIEVQIAPSGRGTLVSIRPYIEEHAAMLTEGRKIWVERYSNGTIERYFFERIERVLGK